MDHVNKTLYIPLRGKAYVSKLGILFADPDAEAIWTAEEFPLKGKSATKWLAYSMGIRAAVFDGWLRQQLEQCPGAVVLHLGCGLDSRCHRIRAENQWFDVDFPAVIAVRKQYFPERSTYHMVGTDLREDWLGSIPRGAAIVVMEGVSMYLTPAERRSLLKGLSEHFTEVRLLMDSYTVFAAGATKYKNPINDVGVTRVYGFDDPRELESGTGLYFLREHDMNPEALVGQLPRKDQGIYRLVYGGKMARKIYRLYEYRSSRP